MTNKPLSVKHQLGTYSRKYFLISLEKWPLTPDDLRSPTNVLLWGPEKLTITDKSILWGIPRLKPQKILWPFPSGSVLHASIQNCSPGFGYLHLLPLSNFGLTLIRTVQKKGRAISGPAFENKRIDVTIFWISFSIQLTQLVLSRERAGWRVRGWGLVCSYKLFP